MKYHRHRHFLDVTYWLSVQKAGDDNRNQRHHVNIFIVNILQRKSDGDDEKHELKI